MEILEYFLMSEETNKPNTFGTALEQWWDSDSFLQLQEASKESVQKAVGKYHMLSDEDKYDMVQAICYIICEAEKKGTSHRGLQSALGLYPQAFWITELMDVHNALYTEFQDRESKEWKQDLENLKNSSLL